MKNKRPILHQTHSHSLDCIWAVNSTIWIQIPDDLHFLRRCPLCRITNNCTGFVVFIIWEIDSTVAGTPSQIASLETSMVSWLASQVDVVLTGSELVWAIAIIVFVIRDVFCADVPFILASEVVQIFLCLIKCNQMKYTKYRKILVCQWFRLQNVSFHSSYSCTF